MSKPAAPHTTLATCRAFATPTPSTTFNSTSLHTIICLVLYTSDVREIETKRGDVVQLATLNVADPSLSGFEIKLWGYRTEWIRRKRVQVGDIVRFTSIKLTNSKYNHVTGATTYYSHVTPLHRQQSYIYTMKLTLDVQSYLKEIVQWSQVTWKGLSELLADAASSQEEQDDGNSKQTGSSSSSSSSNKRKRQSTDCLDNLSDGTIHNITAYLKYVHAAAARPAWDRNPKKKTMAYGVAILSDGNQSEILLKLWNTFSSNYSINNLKKNIGQRIECTYVTTKHCKWWWWWCRRKHTNANHWPFPPFIVSHVVSCVLFRSISRCNDVEYHCTIINTDLERN